MLNRRHLRIKVLQTLFAYSNDEDQGFLSAKKELLKAIEQMYDLYIFLLLILPELKKQAIHRHEENKKKHLPTEEDLHPNLKFVDNQIVSILENIIELRHQSESRKISWKNDERQELMRKLFNSARASETFFEFMNNGIKSFEDDKEFAVQLFKIEIANFPLLYDFFEERSIYWLDDIDLACAMVIKTIKKFSPENENKDNSNSILPLYKPDDDEQEFIISLLRETIKHKEENLQLIDKLTKNWELNRIAKMDVLLMEMALTELVTFNNIPSKVTLNEYIEISKFYSTPESNSFINGVLDKAIIELEKEGKIKKIGRGLMK